MSAATKNLDPAIKFLTRAAIEAAKDRAWEAVHCPEWKDDTGAEYVCVQQLSGTQRSEYQASLVTENEEGKRVVSLEYSDIKLAVLSLVDFETREQLFTLDEIKVLGAKAATPINRIVEVAQRLSALNKKEVEGLKAGLKDTPNAASTSS